MSREQTPWVPAFQDEFRFRSARGAGGFPPEAERRAPGCGIESHCVNLRERQGVVLYLGNTDVLACQLPRSSHPVSVPSSERSSSCEGQQSSMDDGSHSVRGPPDASGFT